MFFHLFVITSYDYIMAFFHFLFIMEQFKNLKNSLYLFRKQSRYIMP